MTKDMIEESVAKGMYYAQTLAERLDWISEPKWAQEQYLIAARAAIAAHTAALASAGYVIVPRDSGVSWFKDHVPGVPL